MEKIRELVPRCWCGALLAEPHEHLCYLGPVGWLLFELLLPLARHLRDHAAAWKRRRDRRRLSAARLSD